jgi:hypothetical protein
MTKFYKGKSAHSKEDILIAYEYKDNKHITNVYLTQSASGDESVTPATGNIFRPVPVIKPHEQNLISCYVCGPSGSGKSFYTAFLVKLLHKQPRFKKAKIYLISSQQMDDKAFDILGTYYKLNINSSDFVRLQWTDFKDSIVVFDDVNSFGSKPLEKFINQLQISLVQNGRKNNIAILNINHSLRDYMRTKYIIEESSSQVLFPKSDFKNCRSYLTDKLAFDKDDIEKIKSLDTRGVLFYREYPQYYVSDREIGVFD